VHYRSPGSIQPYQAVLADSHGIPRAPRYSGTLSGVVTATRTGLSPTPAGHSHTVPLHPRFLTPRPIGGQIRKVPQPPRRNPRRVSHATGLGSIRFRSPLLTESLLFSLPPGTEMFHFPGFPPHTLFHSGAGDWPSRQPGSPIRTPPDQRSVDSSPGPIAASHVLHRLLVPRHPPCALTHLPTPQGVEHIKALQTETQKQKPRHTTHNRADARHSHY
jgi:hypothetical protein